MSEQADDHPYTRLGPDTVLDALESVGFEVDGRLLPLNSYENRVYQVGIEDQRPVVVKFYRPERWSEAAILEEHAFAEALAAAEIPVVAPIRHRGETLHTVAGFRFAVYPSRGGRAPELDDADTLEWLGRYLGRIHTVGEATTFRHRPQLDPGTAATAREYLLSGGWIPDYLRDAYESVTAELVTGIDAAFERAGGVASIAIHGDCHPGNILWTEAGPHIVDLDDCCTGPAVQDLWMLLSGDRAEMTGQLSDILAGYEDFRDFDRRELNLVEALRTLRVMRYAAWLAQRWHDPAFPRAFPWFAEQRYWEEHLLGLREQLAALQEPVLVV
ncbi:Stress response kinase A [wastewater metagenome]|uniref:Stress response kinase A n=2 Tax=unclassified sequences TaxID=12908 RepID=A0A5B8RAC3_9ZZZZ|nr:MULTISPECIES: serine/threonine protein kinase [Arhodomonas]MCS4505517.1 serine/threonine protein kinase [Arhodomonas aquaeolei]QEA04352.1 stress response kinase A [uncultured organism]